LFYAKSVVYKTGIMEEEEEEIMEDLIYFPTELPSEQRM
jgi:hypothetical protein